jgi:hypothetical protein
MPTTYNSRTPALDRPYQPGEFARYAETTGQNATPVAPPEEAPYSEHPALQVEAERAAVNSLAMPAQAHRGDTFVPPSDEVLDHHVAVEAASLIGGMENLLSRTTEPSASQLGERLDQMADDPMAPAPESLQYRQGDEVTEAYNSACAVMAVRRMHSRESI